MIVSIFFFVILPYKIVPWQKHSINSVLCIEDTVTILVLFYFDTIKWWLGVQLCNRARSMVYCDTVFFSWKKNLNKTIDRCHFECKFLSKRFSQQIKKWLWFFQWNSCNIGKDIQTVLSSVDFFQSKFTKKKIRTLKLLPQKFCKQPNLLLQYATTFVNGKENCQ